MANRALVLYEEFIHNNADKFKTLKSSTNATTKELTQLFKAVSSTKELPDNPAALYDSLSNIRKLASMASETTISDDAKEVMNKIGKQTTFDDANSHLLDYSKASLDMASLPSLVTNLCDTINQNFQAATPDKLESLVTPLCDELQTRVSSAIDKMRVISAGVGSIGQVLKDAFRDFVKVVKEKVVPKIVEFVKKIMDMIQRVELMLIENKLSFANKVSELAKKNKWNLKELVVEMPEFSINSVEILTFKVPFPTISIKSWVAFTPAVLNPK